MPCGCDRSSEALGGVGPTCRVLLSSERRVQGQLSGVGSLRRVLPSNWLQIGGTSHLMIPASTPSAATRSLTLRVSPLDPGLHDHRVQRDVRSGGVTRAARRRTNRPAAWGSSWSGHRWSMRRSCRRCRCAGSCGSAFMGPAPICGGRLGIDQRPQHRRQHHGHQLTAVSDAQRLAQLEQDGLVRGHRVMVLRGAWQLLAEFYLVALSHSGSTHPRTKIKTTYTTPGDALAHRCARIHAG